MLKNQIFILSGSAKRATTNIIYYDAIDLSKEDITKSVFKSSNWEYFPASNSFKYFVVDQAGNRKYLTNGWYAYNITGQQEKTWYRFDKNGLMQRGFIEDGGKYYYLNNDPNELGYMVKGYRDFVGTGCTGYFDEAGVLKYFIPTSMRVAFESKAVASPEGIELNKEVLKLCMTSDAALNKLVESTKTSGQCALGNVVGYWYTYASGVKKFRFETINNELQVARFAKEGWMNIYDEDNKLYSYRFDTNANMMKNTMTAENVMLDAKGHAIGKATLINFATADQNERDKIMIASLTENSLPVNAGKLISTVVGTDGKLYNTEYATELWTSISFEKDMPTLTNSLVKTFTTLWPLQFLSNMQKAVSATIKSFSK